MKKFNLLIFTLFCCSFCVAQNVAINNDGSVADNSAILDIKSLSKGLLVPRMSASERSLIPNPATGLLIYQKDGSTGFYYNAGPSSAPVWLQLNSSIAGGWNLTGNAGTNAATNFIGTTDNQPIIFKHNNKLAARFDYNLLNYFIGNQSGEISTGRNNVALGNLALGLTTSGYSNVAIGSKALYSNTVKSNLVAIGDSALYNNGNESFFSTEGVRNTAVGSKALYSNTRGNSNSALGFESLKDNSTGYNNTAVGSKALTGNTIGSRNTAIGAEALAFGNGGSDNIGIGVYALPGASGSKNIAIGNSALRYSGAGYANIAIGYESMRENSIGNHNVAIGGEITLGGANSTTMTGSNNIAVGSGTLYWNTTGAQNTAIGYGANWYNQTGNYNTAIGYFANCGWPDASTPGTLVNATAIGTYAIVNQNNSMVLGSIEGVGYGTASVNVGIGTITPQARLHIKSNSSGNATNSQLMLEEDGDDYTRLTMKNTINPSKFWDMAAYSNAANASARLNFYYQGVGDILSLKGDGNATLVGTLTQLSDNRLKKDIVPINNALEKLTHLNGYNYYWSDENKDQSLQTGVLAQEVEKVMPELVKKDEKGILSVNYSGIIPVLIQSIKEQQKQIDDTQTHRTDQQKQIEKLKKDNLDLKGRLDKIEKILVNN